MYFDGYLILMNLLLNLEVCIQAFRFLYFVEHIGSRSTITNEIQENLYPTNNEPTVILVK